MAHTLIALRDMHSILLKTALSAEGEGPPARMHVNHRVKSIDHENAIVVFEGGKSVHADMIIGSDGIRSAVRPAIGIE
jgi:salicylate hydroxylase